MIELGLNPLHAFLQANVPMLVFETASAFQLSGKGFARLEPTYKGRTKKFAGIQQFRQLS